MRHLARHLALAACLALTGSIAHAAPARHRARVTKKTPHKKTKKSAKHTAKLADVVDDRPAADDANDADDAASEKPARHHSRSNDVADDDVYLGDHDRVARTVTARGERTKAPHHRADLDGDRTTAEDLFTEERAGRDDARSNDDDDTVSDATKLTRHHALTKTPKHHRRLDDDRASDDTPAADSLAASGAPRLSGVAHHPRAHADGDTETDRVAFADPDQPARARDADTIQIDAPVKIHKLVAPASKDWHVAIGPYLWASAVDANVSLGPTTVSSGVDFVQLEQHARYGMELVGEARYKQFGIYGDLMYGVVAVDGSRDVGPLMVSLAGEASSVLIDGAAGYTFYGDDHSLLSLEARGGVRYQRTGVSATLGLSGATVAPPEQISAGADALAGGHAVVRPVSWFFMSGTADIGVVGASSRTWSASADANVQLGPRVLLSVGYRTLTMDRTQVELVMHGPRAAFQLTF
jgi:hypothetical protein